jgi:uncharacterized protein (DUF1697 family)
MTRYIALLRGVNIGGRNKISMQELKTAFENHGFQNVLTYINSGNILFDSVLSESDAKTTCETIVKATFGLDIPVRITTATELQDVLRCAPDWWDNAVDTVHNAIFVIPPMTAEEICKQVGEAKSEFEKVACCGSVILWSAARATFSKTRWSKLAGIKTANSAVTIRNANTTKRLLELAKNQ